MTGFKLLIATQFPQDLQSPRGGVEAVSVNLVKFLAKYENIDVHVATLIPGLGAYEAKAIDGATVHYLPRPIGSELSNAVSRGGPILTGLVEKIKPDIVHAHDTYGMMLRNLDIPKVFTVHGFIYGDTLLSERRMPRLRSLVWEYFEKSSWSKQPNIISISPYVRERITPVATGRIFDIENPISDRFFSIERQVKSNRLFSSAVISPRKNPIVLVQAVKQLAEDGLNPELRLAGGITNNQYADRMFNLIKDSDLEANVTHLGNITVDQVMNELREAATYLLVSLEENSPMGIEEAMAAGVPVITSNRCGMPYMVRNNETGYLVDPFSVSDVASKIKRLITNDTVRENLGNNAKAFATAWYHPKEVARRTRDVYEDILSL